jgi:hypothetical protein
MIPGDKGDAEDAEDEGDACIDIIKMQSPMQVNCGRNNLI